MNREEEIKKEDSKYCQNCGVGKITENDELDCIEWKNCKGNATREDENLKFFWTKREGSE